MSWEIPGSEDEATKTPAPLEQCEGALTRISNADYHARPEFSSSDIKHMLKSPAHFRRLVLEKQDLEREPNSAFDLGTCAHSCYLENDTGAFVCAPDVDRRTKAGKEEYARFVDDNAGRIILAAEQYSRVIKMYAAIAKNPRAVALVTHRTSTVEESFVYIDPDTGLKCKFRPDILNTEAGFIADYKTAQSASPHEFAKAVARYHYHLSAAHYIAGVERLTGIKIRDYIFVVQEKDEPFAIAIYNMTPEDIERSLALRKQIMRKIKHCHDMGDWSDYSAKALTLSIPGYGFEFKEAQ